MANEPRRNLDQDSEQTGRQASGMKEGFGKEGKEFSGYQGATSGGSTRESGTETKGKASSDVDRQHQDIDEDEGV